LDGAIEGFEEGVTSLAINYVTEKLELDPLTANAIMLAVGGAIDGAQDGDILKGITDAYTNALLNATSFGVARIDPETGQIQISQGSSWQEAAYISRVLDITDSLKEKGLEQTLYDYSTSVLHCEAVNGFTRPGGVYDILGEHLSEIGDVAFEIIDNINGTKKIINTDTGKTIGQYREEAGVEVLETGEYATNVDTGEEELKDGRQIQTNGNETAAFEIENGKRTKVTVTNKETGDVATLNTVNGEDLDGDNYSATITPGDGDYVHKKTVKNGTIIEGEQQDLGQKDSQTKEYKKYYKDKFVEELYDYDVEDRYFDPPDDNDDPPSSVEILLYRIIITPPTRIDIILPPASVLGGVF